MPHVEPRIVIEHRPDTGQHGARALAPRMAVDACGLAGDPLACAVVQRGAPVERSRDLHAHPGPCAQHAREESDVQLARLVGEHTDVDRDAGGTQARDALPRDQRVRVAPRRPRRATLGFESARRTHGGVRPWCEHGSSVTYTVAPRTSWPASRAARSATTSACGPPACCVWPRASSRLGGAKTTQPTRGLGSTTPMLCAAQSSATRIVVRSL